MFFTTQAHAVTYSDNPNAAQECHDQGQNYTEAVKFVQKLQGILTKNDADAFAELGAYPVTVNYGQANTRTIKIKTTQELADQYNRFITSSMKQGILTDPDIECTEEGTMVYGGVIWFNADNSGAKLTVINSQAN
jgi:hypothetical protein